jgi:hypothetical protein
MVQHIVAYFNLRRRDIDIAHLTEEEYRQALPQRSHLDDIIAGDGSTPSSGGGGETPQSPMDVTPAMLTSPHAADPALE